ncbi:MAG: glycoside hydrolase family 20 zincin-like fold domain-containing protein [Bacillota bacterium]|nr:glycoside hydrolase family 20 zincin-like fold domain-containing protein [Bacillota bacterium]
MKKLTLFPMPAKVDVKGGTYKFSDCVTISISAATERIKASAELLINEFSDIGIKAEITNNNNGSIVLNNFNTVGEGYILSIDKHGIVINGGEKGILYGISTIRQLLRTEGNTLPFVNIDDKPILPVRGFLLDISRGKVCTMETLKEVARRCVLYKINQLQLYVEHSFAFSFAEEMWKNRTPITADEIREFDEYCDTLGIELVPCLATFGHLYELLEIQKYRYLREVEVEEYKKAYFLKRMAHHTLDVSNNDSFELVKKMIDEYAPLFKSDKFNICCDETMDLGLGKSKELAEKLGVGKIYVDFLNRIIDYARKYKSEIQFWGDIIVQHPELIKDIRPGCVFLNWGYGAEIKDDKTKIFADSGVRQVVCPGTNGWNKIFNNITNGFSNINISVSYALKYKAEGILNTDWGDYGHINPISTSFPGLAYGGGLAWNYTGSDIQEYDRAISIIDFGDERILPLMKKAGEAAKVSWANIVRWYYYDRGELDEFFVQKYGKGLDRLNLASGELDDNISRLKEINEALEALKDSVCDRSKEDLTETLVAIRGLVATQMWAHTMLSGKGKKDSGVAAKLDEFANDLSVEWHRRYKKTDLRFLLDIISYIANRIR